MSKRIVYTNSNSSKLFDENISYLKKQITNGNTDFILILPNRKLIKNIRNKFLKEQSVLPYFENSYSRTHWWGWVWR